MIEVLVEITGFNSLEKIDPDFTDKLLGDIKSILEIDPAVSVKRIGSCFLFGFTPGIDDLNRLILSILSMYDYLQSIADDLRGFTVFVNQTKGLISKVEYEGFVRDIYALEKDNSLYASKNAAELFKGYSVFEESGNYLIMVSHKNLRIQAEKGIVDFVAETKDQEEFTTAFTPFLNGERSGIFFFYNPDTRGIPFMGYALSKYIEGTGGKDLFLPWLRIFPESNDYFGFAALLNSFSREFLSSVPSYLTGTEQKVWEELYPLIHSGYSVSKEEDAALLFRLYVSAYIRYFESENFPPIIFIMDSDKLKDSAMEIISEVVGDLSEEFDPIPVLFSASPDIPACFHNFNSFKYPYDGGSGEGSPVNQYHSYLLKEQKEVELSGPEATKYLLGELDAYSRRLLNLTFLLDGLFNSEEVVDLLCEEDSDRLKYIHVYKELVSCGYIYPDRMRCVFPELMSGLKEFKNNQGNKVLDRIYHKYRRKNDMDPQVLSTFYKIFEAAGDFKRSAEFKLSAVNSLIDLSSTEEALPLIKELKKTLKKNSLSGSDQDVCADAMFLKAAIFDSRIPLVNDLVRKAAAAEDVNDEMVRIVLKSILSEALYSEYEFHESLNPAKEALLIAQNAGLVGEESGINTLLGKIMLGMQRIEEAKDYFRISRETLTTQSGKILPAKTIYFEAVTYYIYGNFSESLRLLEKALEISREYGSRRWEIIILFAKGRIHFDLGRYGAAVEIFSECLAVSRIYNSTESHETVYPWIARALVYGGRKEEGARILREFPDSAEGSFFYSEYMYFQGRYPEAEESVNRAIKTDNDRIHVFLSPDFILKDSGFEYMEDLVFVMNDGHGVLSHLLKAFRAYLSVLNGNHAEGTAELERLTRDDKLSDIDPFNGLYFFFQALSLPEKDGTDSLNRLTMLSKSLRHVQAIASRIDTPRDRMDFLFKNYWNSRLMESAKKNKLL